MVGFHGTLVNDFGQCKPDCSLCEEACKKCSPGGKDGRIQAVHLPEVGFHGLVKCIQCSDPACNDFCPTGAITKHTEDGIVRINEEKCIGCGLCTLGCPYGGVYYDPERKKPYKCDKCDGEPECTSACESEVLTYAQSRPILEHLGEELQSRGIGMCQGCGEEVAIRLALRTFGKNTIVFMGPGCTPSAFSGTSLGSSTISIPSMNSYMTNLPAIASGVRRYFKKIGKEANIVAFAGDGLTSDVGFQCLSGAAERGENIIYICLDNEAYMNTGVQRSATTPQGSWTTTTPVGEKGRGKPQRPKYMPLIMAFHNVPYVATASPYFLEDYIQKLAKAKEVKDGLAYIHIFAPCPTGWRSPIDSLFDLSKLAVETNYFPLWEADHGRFRFTYMPREIKPIETFSKMMGRFSHLNEQELQDLQKMVDERYHQIEVQCNGGGQGVEDYAS